MDYVYIVTAKVPYSDDTRHAIRAFTDQKKAWAYIEAERERNYYYDFDVMDCELET